MSAVEKGIPHIEQSAFARGVRYGIGAATTRKEALPLAELTVLKIIRESWTADLKLLEQIKSLSSKAPGGECSIQTREPWREVVDLLSQAEKTLLRQKIHPDGVDSATASACLDHIRKAGAEFWDMEVKFPEPQEAKNVCEHGDHPAPVGKRFCSPSCAKCETESTGENGCDGICHSSEPPGVPQAPQPQRIDQTVTGPKGNCFSACLAMMLGLQITEVPNFCDSPGFDEDPGATFTAAAREWLAVRGWGYIPLNSDAEIFQRYFSKGFLMAVGKSSRGLLHSVIYKDGILWHDPHPSHEGINEVTEVDLLFPLNPAAMAQGATA